MGQKERVLSRLNAGIIVSCQSHPGEPLYEAHVMDYMAEAAVSGGAVGIRANGPDIAAIRCKVDVPILGIYKKEHTDGNVYITPTLCEVDFIVEAGADIVTFDALSRARPDGTSLEVFIHEVRRRYPDIILMADISTVEEGVNAVDLGVDLVATTLSGYTPYSTSSHHGPDILLISALKDKVDVPVIAEGRIDSPEHAHACLIAGAFAVVVGSAITRPHHITNRFLKAVNSPVN